MKLIEVVDKKTKQLFHDVVRVIYKGDKEHTCQLDVEIEGIFDKSNNRKLEHGEAIRWVLVDDKGTLIGRIAAFYDKEKAYKNDQPTGGVGFFECIENKDAAYILFDAGKKWLEDKGMEAMDGPVNFGENFVHWGLLVKGFTHQGYGMPYNKPYYQNYFDEYGFQCYFNMYSYHYDLSKPLPERHEKFADHLMQKGNFTFEHFKYSNKEKYLNNVVDIYNAVWADFHEDYSPLVYEDMVQMLEDAKPIIKEEFIWFVYDEGKPCAMVIVFPDINQLLDKLGNGKLNLINKLKFLYYKNTGVITRARQLLTGVVPEYQKSGVIGAMFVKMVRSLREHNIKELELSWVGEYNQTVMKLYRMLGAEEAKMHVTYRYLFDRTKEFKKFTNEESDKSKKARKTDE